MNKLTLAIVVASWMSVQDARAQGAEPAPPAGPPPTTEAPTSDGAAPPTADPTAPAVPEAPAAPAVEAAVPAESRPASEAAPVTNEPAPSVSVVADEEAPAARRRGLYFGFGFGVGGGTFADEAIAGAGAALFHLRAGVAVTERVLVGVELSSFGQYNQWSAMTHTGSAMSSLMGQGTYYATPALSVTGGVGWGSGLAVNRKANDSDGDARVVADSGHGVSWMAGVGYDVYAGPSLTLTTQARYDGASVGAELNASHTGSLNLLFSFY